jgi:hypothetical protein
MPRNRKFDFQSDFQRTVMGEGAYSRPSDIGLLIQQKMVERGMTIAQLAAQLDPHLEPRGNDDRPDYKINVRDIEDLTRQVVFGLETPTGEMTRQICRALGCAPRELWDENIPANYPSHIVEAEILEARERGRDDPSLDAFLTGVDATLHRRGYVQLKRLDMEVSKAVDFAEKMYSRAATIATKKDGQAWLNINISPVDRHVRKIENALKFYLKTLHVDNGIKRALVKTHTDVFDKQYSTLKLFTNMITMGGQGERLIDAYLKHAEACGTQKAAEELRGPDAEEFFPLAHAWRSKPVRLTNGNELRGSTLLDRIIADADTLFATMETCKKHIKIADEAETKERRWVRAFRTPALQHYVLALAQSRCISDMLGLPRVNGRLALPAPQSRPA